MDQKIKIALEILDDEIKGDVKNALQKMHEDYSMTWVYKNKKGILFPYITSENIKSELNEVYNFPERKYDIKNVCSSEKCVIIEMIESYYDPEDKKTYRTPQIIVLEYKDNKIRTGRHYCDPQISYLNLSEETLNKIYK
ncbi:MAG: hypothetical protein WCG60_01950 [bacterium]